MHWDFGPAEAGGLLAALMFGYTKAKAKLNGGTMKERLVRVETKVDDIREDVRELRSWIRESRR